MARTGLRSPGPGVALGSAEAVGAGAAPLGALVTVRLWAWLNIIELLT
jgi:hypothetical protein